MMNNNALSSEEEATALYLLEQAMSYTWCASLRAIAFLGVADRLTLEAKTAEQLAGEMGLEAQPLVRAMRMLASRGVFKQDADGAFSLTPAAEFLRADHPFSLRAGVLMLTDKTFWLPSLDIVEILRGKSAFNALFGKSFYDYWTQENIPVEENYFHAGMSSMSMVENEIIVRHYAFPENATVADIAGGFGGLLLKVLQHNPALYGILFDRPQVLPGNRLAELGDNSRWELKAGSFFESCPQADFYLLKYIVMDWPDKEATQILRTCRQAMRAEAKVLLFEPVIADTAVKHGVNEIDSLLLASFDGGRVRTQAELSAMMSDAGLKLNRIIDTGFYISIVEAVAA